MPRPAQTLGFTFLLSLAAASAPAGDGVLEINQACAETTGCFPQDNPGFPVEMKFPGIYRLTGPLALGDPDATALHARAEYVEIDLAGFPVSGPGRCVGTGAALSCTPSGAGVGIAGVGGTTVRNSTVRGFAGGGLQLEDDARLSDLRVLENGGPGS